MSRFATATASFRQNPDDRVLVVPVGPDWIVCVADGTGGRSGGAQAADMFVASVRQAVDERINLTDSAAWISLLHVIDEEIRRDPSAGETTGIAIAVTGTSIVGASVGDSRAWLFSDGAAELTANQHRKPRLGSGHSRPESFTAAPHGILVAGTDGLFDHVGIDEIRAVATQSFDRAADAVAQLPRGRSGTLPDDVAVAIGWLDAAA
jgi:PPM family protein phosphatase